MSTKRLGVTEGDPCPTCGAGAGDSCQLPVADNCRHPSITVIATERNGDPRFDYEAPNEVMLAQLTRDIADAWEKKTQLSAIVDMEAGVIAYAVGEFNAERIVNALSACEPGFDDDHRPELALHVKRGRPFTVGVNIPESEPVRLRSFATHDEAAAFIDTLDGAEDGRYYLDGPED